MEFSAYSKTASFSLFSKEWVPYTDKLPLATSIGKVTDWVDVAFWLSMMLTEAK